MTCIKVASLLIWAVVVFTSASVSRDQCSATRYCRDGTKCCADKLHCCPVGYKCCSHFTKCCRGGIEEVMNSAEPVHPMESEVVSSLHAIEGANDNLGLVGEGLVTDERLNEIMQRAFKINDDSVEGHINRRPDGNPVD